MWVNGNISSIHDVEYHVSKWQHFAPEPVSLGLSDQNIFTDIRKVIIFLTLLGQTSAIKYTNDIHWSIRDYED